jgi:hypothetical protein
VQALYADSYTLAGCSNADHCGIFTRVPAHCTSPDSIFCPGGEFAHGNTDPTLCDGAPVYQKGGSGSGGPVLLRYYDGGTFTSWIVAGGSFALEYCNYNELYLQSDMNLQPVGSALTAPAYNAGGWTDNDAGGISINISVTAGSG